MAEIRFVKYNRTRKEAFQIKTSIVEDTGVLYVEKTALHDEGTAHIRAFDDRYIRLSEQSELLKLVRPKVSSDGRTAVFKYLEGKTFAELLGEQIAQMNQSGETPQKIIGAINKGLRLIYSIKAECISDFYMTRDFKEVFDFDGSEPQIVDNSYDTSNIDALFENLIVTNEGIFALDYEWVFTFPIPAHFVRYRTLIYFYQRFESLLNYKNSQEFLKEFNIEECMLPVYEKMERGFQKYVHGENQRTYEGNYITVPKTVNDMILVEAELERAKENIDRLKAELSEKNSYIKKTQEIQRLTNNHVGNLDALIASLRHEVEEMGKTLSYLNDHEAIIFKARRKIGDAFNKRYPKGTRKRKMLGYWKNAVFHPVHSFSMFTTEEGKNRIKGDLAIGEEYLRFGKLSFLKEKSPKVSIVIPVYNQIHYTYLCLQSILEHTKDVSYEVIIADDVSGDATEHLSEFVEHITICRNTENQGFLKNCNNAAKAAGGQFVMFLNNDTQVTEGWLSALVNLIEADPSIGMVGSKLVYPDGRLQEAGGILWSDGSGWNYGRLDDPDKAEYNYVKDVDYISGAAILLSVNLWKQIGGFDERFAPAYCEDSDLAFEVRKAGYRVVYQPLSKVIHFEGISNGTDVNGTGLKRYQVENSEKLRDKWKEEFAKQCVNTGSPSPFRARERSMGKPVILVIDHYVPTYDKDAGSKTTFQYLKLFLKKGYTVKFVGDNYLHEEPYTTTLLQMGIEVLYGTEYLTGIWDWLDKNGKDISFAYLNRPHIAAKYVDYIEEHTDIKIIYYGHDLHFLRELREYELTGDLQKKQASNYWKSIEFSLMQKALVSYFPSYVEAEAIRAIDGSIHVKPITAYVYETFLDNINQDYEGKEGLLFVGGFSHPPNADAVLWFSEHIFPLIREKLLVNFYIVGSSVTDEIRALEQPENGIIVKGFVSEEELSKLYGSCKLVVVPLRYGAGVKGKVVEAIYNGVPVVTTSVGSEGIPGSGEVLVVEDKPELFAQAVIELYHDNARLKKLSDKSQEYIKAHFSVDAVWDIIREDFNCE